MELDYLVPVDQRRAPYYNNCNHGNNTSPDHPDDDYTHTDHIYEELKEPPLPLPERTYKKQTNGTTSDRYVEGGAPERKKRINSTYQTSEETSVLHSEYPCCKRRKCFILVIIVFILSGVTTAALLFHLFPEEPAGKPSVLLTHL